MNLIPSIIYIYNFIFLSLHLFNYFMILLLYLPIKIWIKNTSIIIKTINNLAIPNLENKIIHIPIIVRGAVIALNAIESLMLENV